MTAKEYLKQFGIEDRVLNREDLSEHWKTISQLMEGYAVLHIHAVSGQSEQLLAFKEGWLSADDHCFDKEERLQKAIDKWKASNSG